MLWSIYYRLTQTPPPSPKPFILLQKHRIPAALGRAVPRMLSDIFSCTTGVSTPTCPRRQNRPEPPPQTWESPQGLVAPGYRIGKCWEEQPEIASGGDPPPLHPAFTHMRSCGTSLTPPEAGHYHRTVPRMVLFSAKFHRGTQQAQTINCQQNPFLPQYDLGILVKHHWQPFSTKYNAHTYGIFYNCVPYCPLCSSQKTKKIPFSPLLSPFVMWNNLLDYLLSQGEQATAGISQQHSRWCYQ